jgi:hypothetical protein
MMIKKITTAVIFTTLLMASTSLAYIGNSNSLKFHADGCRAAQKINAANRVYFDTRDDAVSAGYVPCGICRP